MKAIYRYRDVSDKSDPTNVHASLSLGSQMAKQLLMGLVLVLALIIPNQLSAAIPTVDNATGASDILSISAVVNGTLNSTGGVATQVYVYWGKTDGGTTFGNWENAVDLGINTVGPLNLGVTNLTPNKTYYYRFYATNLDGNAWAIATTSFTTLAAAGPLPVNLGSTANFTILAGAAVTTTGGGIINGDVGAYPIDGASILIPPVQVNGTIYARDASGTQAPNVVIDPVLLLAAKGDLTIAYNDAAGRTPVPSGPFLNPGAGNIGGLNLIPGLYKFTATALITGADVTLTGGPNDVWIFQIASDLQVGSGIKVILAGGARAKNIFWQVGTSAVLDTSCVFKGTIIADQAVTMKTSSTMQGRALAFSAGVTFNGSGGSLPPDNAPPVAVNNDYSTDLTTTLNVAAPGVLINDTDVDGNTLTAVKVTDPVDGTLTLNTNGSFAYTPPANWDGIDSFTYKANDGLLDSNIATVTITVPAYSLTVVNGTGSGSYFANKLVPVIATTPVGKVFDTWSGDTGYLASTTDAATIVTMPTTNITVTAVFKDAPVDTYTLTVINGTGGSSYAAGTAVAIAAVIPVGKVFDTWSGDTGYLAAITDAATIATMPAANITVTAVFKDKPVGTYTLTVVSGTGGGAYTTGQFVPITTIVPAGKVFSKWAGDITHLADPASSATIVTMPATDITVAAIFNNAPPSTYTLTVANGTGGGSYAAGALVPITTVVPVGKVFDTWAGDITYLAAATDAATIVTMPAANITVTATFKDAPVGTYTLTVVNGTGGGSYAAGQFIPVTAVVPAGKVFDKWIGDTSNLAATSEASTIATMPTANITVTAIFKDAPAGTYTLTVVNGTGGGSYAAGALVPITNIVPVGKVFDKWTGDITYLAAATDAATIVTMPAANITVTAIFKDAPASTYTLTVLNGTGGGSYAAGGLIPITAVIPTGKVFNKWTGDTANLADPTASATIATMPAANITITAVFTDAPTGTYTLTVVNGTGNGSYAAGTAVAITAVVPAGKVFDKWSGDTGYLADATASATITTMPAANIAVTAVFTDAPAGTYTLTVVNGTGSGSYLPGKFIPVIATIPAGKVFNTWAGDTGYLAAASEASTIATMPAAHITITAVFTDAPAGTYSLTVVNGTGSGSYLPGKVVTVTATIPSKKVFSKWVGDTSYLIDATASVTVVTMPNVDVTVTATFTDAPADTYTLTVVNGTGGGSYAAETEIFVSAVIPDGKIFDKWVGDISYITDTAVSSGIVTMPAADITISAVFRNTAPVATNDQYNTDEDTTLNVLTPGVLDNDTDANGISLSAVRVTNVTHGTLTLNADGSFSYIPEANWNGVDSFNYKANNGTADSNVATVTITVGAVSGASDVDMYLARMKCNINWAKHANGISDDRLTIRGRINPAGAYLDLNNASVTFHVNGVQLLPPAETAGAAPSGYYGVKLEWRRGFYTLIIRGVDLRSVIGVPNVTADINKELSMLLSIENADLDTPVVAGTFECRSITTQGRSSQIRFNSKLDRTITGIYKCSKTWASDNDEDGYGIRIKGVIEAEGDGTVQPTGDITVRFGNEVLVVPFSQIVAKRQGWSYRSTAPGITGLVLHAGKRTFTMSAYGLTATGIPTKGPNEPTSYRLPIQLQIPTAEGVMFFESTIELLRRTGVSRTWTR